jgi:hypothetical protein
MMRGRALFIALALQAGTVLLGYLFGVAVHYVGRPPSIYTACALLAGLWMLIGVGVSAASHPARGSRLRAAVRVGALVYASGVVRFEPFLHVHSHGEFLLAVLVLIPPLLAIAGLVRDRAWMSVAGVALFVFTCSAMLASNANVIDAGSGFWRWWG